MKKNILYTLFICAAFTIHLQINAQASHTKVQRMPVEQRIENQADFVTKSLMLNDDINKKFKPIYIAYLKELQGCMHSLRLKPSAKNGTTRKRSEMTDEQIEKDIQRRFDESRRILDIREKYYKEFRKVLTPRQVLKVYSAERYHHDKVRKELEKRHKLKK